MPIKKSAKKKLKQDKKRTIQNTKVKKQVKLLTKRGLEEIAAKAGDAEKTVREACKAIDKACKKGVLKANTAARKKSRLTKKLNAILKK